MRDEMGDENFGSSYKPPAEAKGDVSVVECTQLRHDPVRLNTGRSWLGLALCVVGESGALLSHFHPKKRHFFSTN